jgi:hypothetical protein
VDAILADTKAEEIEAEALDFIEAAADLDGWTA